MRTIVRRLVLVGTLLLAVLAAGCAADDSGGADDASDVTAGSTAPLPPGEPIRLMVNFTSEGVDANPQIVEGALAAARALNNAGGIQDRPLEIIPCDNHNDPNEAAECGRQAVAEGAVASVGDLTQQSTEYLPIYEENQIAALGNSPANPASFTSPASFPITGGAVSNFAGLGRYVADAGAEAIAVVRPDIGPAAIAQTLVAAGTDPVGAEVVNDIAVPADAPDMASYAAAALDGGADGIVLALGAQQAINFIQAAQQTDPDVVIGFVASSLDEVIDALGAGAEGLILAEFLVPPDVETEGTAEYVQEMTDAGYSEVGALRNTAWLSVHVFAQVAADLPEITNTTVFEALGRAEGLTSPLTPPIQFTEGGVFDLPRVFTGCTYATTLGADGVAEPVTGTFFDPFADAECETPA